MAQVQAKLELQTPNLSLAQPWLLQASGEGASRRKLSLRLSKKFITNRFDDRVNVTQDETCTRFHLMLSDV